MAQLARRAPYPRALVAAVVVALVATMAFMAASPDAKGASSVSTRRLGGVDRYDTAREIAVSTFGSRDQVILARGENYPDALAGNYVAGGSPGAPIVLTPQNALSDRAVDAMNALGAKGVIILGGVDAISQNVENQLKTRGLTTTRLFGTDRYGTAAKIAGALKPAGTVAGQPTAVIASGEGFADALTGGPLSYTGRLPMLLTAKTSLPAPTDTALSDLGIKHVIILGGTDAVGPSIEARLTAKGITFERLFGATRRGTATAIANAERTRFGFGASHVNLARGDAFPDALAGGPHAATELAPILLTDNPNALGTETAGYLRTNAQDVATIDAYGGTAAVSDATLAAAAAAATCASPASTTSTSAGGGTTTTTAAGGTTTTTTAAGVTTTTAGGSTTSTTAGQPVCVTSTTTSAPGSTTSTTVPQGQQLCAVNPVPGCPNTTTTTSPTSTTSAPTTSTSTTSTTAAP